MGRLKIFTAIILLLLAAAFWALWTPDLNRAYLDGRYLQSPADMVEVLDQRLHVRDSGPKSAPAVVFIHGFGSSLHTWEPWAQSLSADLRVLRLDLPGSGLSPPDARNDYSDARSVALIKALMDARGIEKASIVGHSIGGRIAWKFAASEPQRVNKLVLIAPDGFASPGFEYGKPVELPAVMGMMRWIAPRWLVRMSLEPAYANPSALDDEILTRYYELMRAPGAREALLARMRQTLLSDPLPQLRRIVAPTLLVWGREDAMIPVTNAADYQGAIAQNSLVTLGSMGHLPMEERPDEALSAVSKFLKGKSGD
jgi:pimeloyl-ACP methyl ester carboxylesterase